MASPGNPKKPEELSLIFIKSHYITHIFQKCCEPQDLRHPQASILLRNFQPHSFNYPFSSKSRNLTLILHRSSRSGNILLQGDCILGWVENLQSINKFRLNSKVWENGRCKAEGGWLPFSQHPDTPGTRGVPDGFRPPRRNLKATSLNSLFVFADVNNPFSSTNSP